jgi:hypothetical protein
MVGARAALPCCVGSAAGALLQRVDLMNAQAPFDYTIQAWV